MKNPILKVLVLVAAAVSAAGFVRADDVTDQIDEAVKAYKSKDYAAAAQNLDAAAQLIRQKRAEVFIELLPKAPDGWTAEDATSSAAGAQMFGGGVSAERKYNKGESSATVKFLTDSPILQGVMMFINNPMLVSSSENGKLERIKGQKALVKYNAKEKSGEINIVVNGTMLIQIQGNDLSAAELKAFAEAIDYSAVAGKL